ncbi:MAG: hypothetical protein IJ678_08430 [Kiritimatiellae bacterium]|nr:hypothetical protein [Kiritimatiellia bacterium]
METAAIHRQIAQDIVREHNAAVRRGVERMQRAAQLRRDAPRGRIPHYQMDAAVYWNGVAQNGVEAMQPSSDFMRDMKRRHLWIGDPHDRPGSAHKPNLVFRHGRWWRKVPGKDDWTLEPPRPAGKKPWWCS